MRDLIDQYIGPLKTYVVIVLDRSGSMNKARAETVSGFNEQIQAIKENVGNVETSVSLVTFGTGVNFEFFDAHLDSLKEMTLDDYHPNGLTALYDAVGMSIDRLKQLEDINDENTSVLMVIISDGFENSSKEYTAETIKGMIMELQATNRWTFSYMGDIVDLTQITDLGFLVGNISTFTASNSNAYIDAFNTANTAIRSYMVGRNGGASASTNFYSNQEQ